MNKDYKRWTDKEHKYKGCVDCTYRNCQQCDDIVDFEKEAYNRLCDLEDKIENGTLVFKKEIPNKYYAVTLCLDYDDKWVWDIHYGPIKEYDERTGFFAIEDGGRSWRVSTNMLFKTKAEAEAKLRELKGERE